MRIILIKYICLFCINLYTRVYFIWSGFRFVFSHTMTDTHSLDRSCRDIILKNMGYTDETLYLLYDTESPLAQTLSDAYIRVLESFSDAKNPIIIREFKNPPQPLYRGGMVNPENPHAEKQNRVITSHNIEENKRVWLNHHETLEVRQTSDTSLTGKMVEKTEHGLSLSSQWQAQQEQQGQSGQILTHKGCTSYPSSEWQKQQEWEKQDTQQEQIDPQIESIKNELISLPAWSIVILVQSTNFRLSTFRIRLELFHRGIHVVEHNHLAYIPEEQFPTFYHCLEYRTDEYVRLQHEFMKLSEGADETRVVSIDGGVLTFGPVETIRWNTWDYTWVENKWGTYPIGETFTEARDLSQVNGRCLVDTYPREDFSIEVCEPFELIIQNGRVLPSPHFPPGFQKLYDWVVQYEWEVMVRELGFGLNPAISTATPLHDINFHERKRWIHLSLGKKHWIYGKKLPKTEVQRFHIDVFVALESVFIGETQVFRDGLWCV